MPAHLLQHGFAAAGIPSVDGIDGFDAEVAADLFKTVALQFELEDLAAAVSERGDGGKQARAHLIAGGGALGIVAGRGEGEILDGDGAALAATDGFADGACHFEAHNLEGQREQIGWFVDVRVLLVEHEHGFLRHVLGSLPR